MTSSDRRLVDAPEREEIAAAHRLIAIDGGTAPVTTFTADGTPSVLQVAGELDVSTAPAFARALRARADARRVLALSRWHDARVEVDGL